MMGMFGGDVFFIDFFGIFGWRWRMKKGEKTKDKTSPKWGMCRMSRSLMIVVQQNCTSCNFELKKP